MPERWVVLPEGADEQTQAGFSEILAVHAVLPACGTHRRGMSSRRHHQSHHTICSAADMPSLRTVSC